MTGRRMRARCVFQKPARVTDRAGGWSITWSDEVTCRGEYRPERGRERIEAGRLTESAGGVLRVRSSAALRAADTSWRVSINGELHQIRGIADVEQLGRFLEVTVEWGVAT